MQSKQQPQKNSIPDNESTANWLREHPDAAKSAFEDREWLESHPRVVRSMVRERKWLEENPDVAKNLYANRKTLKNIRKQPKR